MLGFGEASPGPSGIAAGPSPSAGATGTPAATSEAPASADPAATPEPTPAATPAPTTAPLADVAVVPVTQFRAIATNTTRAEVAKVLAGTSTRYEALVLVEGEADAILTAVGASRPADADRLVLVPDAAALAKDLAKHRKRLAFLRADAVTPAVRALAWGGRTLFGVDRVTTAAEWRLHAQLPARCRRRRLRSGRDVDDVRRRRHPPGPRRVPDDPDQGQGRRLPVRRRDGRDHRPHLLLGVRLGAARHQADRQRRRDAGADQGRGHRHRQLREPGTEPRPLAYERDGLLGRPRDHRRPGERRHRLRLARQQPHRRRRRRRDPPDDRQPQGARPGLLGRGQGFRGGAQARDPGGGRREGRRARVRRDRLVLRGRRRATPAVRGSR